MRSDLANERTEGRRKGMVMFGNLEDRMWSHLIWSCGIHRLRGEGCQCSEREGGGYTRDEGVNGVAPHWLTRRERITYIAATIPTDANLVICNAHRFFEVERGNSHTKSIPGNRGGGEKDQL